LLGTVISTIAPVLGVDIYGVFETQGRVEVLTRAVRAGAALRL